MLVKTKRSPTSHRRIASKRVNAMLKRSLRKASRKSRTQAKLEKMLVSHMAGAHKVSASGRRCLHGVKKSGACKAKPGRRSRSRSPATRKRVRVGALLSKRLAKMLSGKKKYGARVSKSGTFCRHGVKKSGACKAKPGKKRA